MSTKVETNYTRQLLSFFVSSLAGPDNFRRRKTGLVIRDMTCKCITARLAL